MNFLKEFLAKDSIKRVIFFTGIALIFYMAKSLIDLILLTFLFTYLINSLQTLLVRQIKKITPVREKFITVILYAFLFISLILIIAKYIPILINQTKFLINQSSEWDFSLYDTSTSSSLQRYLISIVQEIDFKSYIKPGLNLATNIGKWSVNLFIAIMLSLFFMLEKKNVYSFLHKFKYSKISGIYEYCSFFGNNFLNSFGKVIQAQILIALVNTALSVAMLSILKFPQLITLGFMIFILSLIPVAGVIISLIPLCLIALQIGGFTKVLYVVIMIAGIHAIESYMLNPKLMSAKVNLPIFLTFIILIVSEHFMGVWGLLIGIPLFMFILDLLDVKLN